MTTRDFHAAVTEDLKHQRKVRLSLGQDTADIDATLAAYGVEFGLPENKAQTAPVTNTAPQSPEPVAKPEAETKTEAPSAPAAAPSTETPAETPAATTAPVTNTGARTGKAQGARKGTQ